MSKTETTERQEDFPITLEEFLPTLTQPESKGAFAALCKTEKIGGHKQRTAWQALFTKFQKKPVGVTWDAWNTSAKTKEG